MSNVATAAPDPDDDDSLDGVDLSQFLDQEEQGLDDFANKRTPPEDEGDDALANMTLRLNAAEDMIRRLWEQMPRRIAAEEDTRVFPVTLSKTSGSDGSKTTAASWVYTATVGTTTIGTGLSPAWPRPNGKMAVATRGLCSKTTTGVVTLEIAYEKPGTASDCS